MPLPIPLPPDAAAAAAPSPEPSASVVNLSAARAKPSSPTDLFVSFTVIALQGFGGVLAIVQRELVEKKRWLTRAEFVEDWAVAQVLPGPNVVNLALMIGGRHFGLKGALAALAGIIACPLVLVLSLAILYAGVADQPVMQRALRGMAAVSAGLIAATGLKLIGALQYNAMGRLVCWAFAAMTFIAVGLLRLPLATVLLSLGLIACLWAYYRLGKPDTSMPQTERDAA
jgi:chromate transporter